MSIDSEFLRQVDNAIRSDLQSWRDLFFHLLVGSSVVVAIGVALEGPEVVHEVRNIWRDPRPEAKPCVLLIGLLGWILVVVGVAGEGVFEGAFSVSDGQIQSFDEILIAEARRDALQAQHDNLQLGIELQNAEKVVANAKKRAAEADIAAEREKIERLKLEARIAPRRLSQEQQRNIGLAFALPQYRQKTVRVVSYALDTEGAILAEQVVSGLTAFSSMQVQDASSSISPISGFLSGIRVSGPDSDLVGKIRSVLSEVGNLSIVPIQHGGTTRGEIRMITPSDVPADATIVIGVKPVQ